MSAPDVEQLICDAVRKALNVNDGVCDRDRLCARIDRIVIQSDQIAITFHGSELEANIPDADIVPNRSTELTMTILISAPKLPPRKGIAHAPLDQETIDFERGRRC